jgi:hypothetical protein
MGTDILEGVDMGLYTPYQMMKAAQNVMNSIAEGHIV